MAFPSSSRISDDADFLQPFIPEDFGDRHVHVPRSPDTGFLFRIDPLSGGSAAIIVQSSALPDWDYAFHNAKHLLSAPPQVKVFEPSFEHGRKYRFRLLANPTRKIDTKTGPDGKKRNGKRVAVPADKLEEWMYIRSERAGFFIDKDSLSVKPSYVYINNSKDGKGQQLRAARYEGIISISDPVKFKEAVVSGIGSGKGYGFGLISVAGI